MVKAHIIFKGKVQGVWFRANCQKKAVELDLKGWVRNLDTGDVECLCVGEKGLIEELIQWNRTSQPYARVDDIEIKWEEGESNMNSFIIRR